MLRLSPRIAPIKAAILPLMKRPELTEIARELFATVERETGYLVDYDETANIGKRYRRQDEIGTPFCFTVDYDSLTDQAVTVRDRDTMTQERLPIADVPAWLRERIA